MEEIRIISTCKVPHVTSNESTQTIELTPWDLRFLMIGPIQRGLIFRKPQTEKYHQQTLINHLKTSFARTLDFFPLLTGRLSSTTNDDNTTSFFINCNNAGAQFTHATINLTTADILEPLFVPNIVGSFFLPTEIVNNNDVSKPLLAVQVTELTDGLFVGCSISHGVVDGTSFWHFFNSWSEISGGLNHISKPPKLKRWFPYDTNCCIRILPSTGQPLMDSYVPPPLQERVFHFSRESIAKLKAKANVEMGMKQISSLQALLAHLWRSVTRCRLDDGKEVTLRLPISARSRLHPPLPEGYFGNTARAKIVRVSQSELLEHGIGWTAWEINKVVASETDEELRRFYEEWVKCPKIVKLSELGSSTSLTVTSSPRFNMYGSDFGWGAPMAVRNGKANKYNGKLTLLPGVEKGGVDIEVCLLPEVLFAMGDDKEFMDAVTF